MKEQELIKIMQKEWKESFVVEKETWCHIDKDKKHGRSPQFKLYIVLPNSTTGVPFSSNKNWQTVYDLYLIWKKEQKKGRRRNNE